VVALVFVSSPKLRINFGSGMLFDSLPGWDELFRLPRAERLKKLKDPAVRAHLYASASAEGLAQQRRRLVDWENYAFEETFSPETKPYEGRNVGDVASELGKTPFETMLDVVVADELRTSLSPRTGAVNRETYALRAQVWSDEERVVVGASDAGAHMDMIDTFAFSTTLLQDAVRIHGVLSPEKAVHLLTEVPAKMMGLRQRGVIKPGWFADLVVFDPTTVGRTPAYTRFDLPGGEPRIYADSIGIDLVVVNGVVIVADGRHTGAKPGALLRSGRDTYTVPLSSASGETPFGASASADGSKVSPS
jgi:N-acyl-D-aspartate/D-glutamate deacylase